MKRNCKTDVLKPYSNLLIDRISFQIVLAKDDLISISDCTFAYEAYIHGLSLARDTAQELVNHLDRLIQTANDL